MKKIILLTMLSATSVLGLAMNENRAEAAQVGTKSTIGKVEFINEAPTDGGAIGKPGEEDKEITIPEKEGSFTTGALRLSFIPSMDFGKIAISTSAMKADAFLTNYTDVETNETGKMPHFVQVVDERGVDAGQFKVTVSASKFTNGSKTIDNAQIDFAEGTITNDRGLEANYTGNARILKTDNQPVTVLSTKTASQVAMTSLVFKDGYVSDDYKTGSNTTTETTNSGVKLTIPKGQSVEKLAYTSTLTWSLEDSI